MPWPKGVPKSAEQRQKLSASLRGRAKSVEHRQRISTSLRGLPKSPEHCRQVSLAKAGVSQLHGGLWNTNHAGHLSHAWLGGLDRYVFGPAPPGLSTPCWLWEGALTGDGTYGVFGTNQGGSIYAHRAMYEREVGPIPEGKELDHLCYVKRCVNPAHLEPVSHLENVRRAVAHYRALASLETAHPHTVMEDADAVTEDLPGVEA